MSEPISKTIHRSDADRFRDFAKLIVNTPKAVVDARAKAHKEARKRLKKSP